MTVFLTRTGILVFLFSVFLFSVFLFPCFTAGAAIYSIRDELGNVHITDTPPDETYGLVLTTFKRPRGFIKPVGTGNTYLDLIHEISQEKGLPWNLLMAIIKTESNFDPMVVSPRGAKGLMQLMPGVCKDYGVKDPFDVRENIRAGAGYFRWLFDRFNNITLAMAAYNAGPGRIVEYNGVPPFKETRQYIKKVVWYSGFYEDKEPLLTLPKASKTFELGIQAMDRGDFLLAKTNFKKVAAQFPDSPEANYNLALISEHMGHPDRAVSLYRKTLAVSPFFKEAHYNLAIIYEQKGLIIQAIETWRGYLQSETRTDEIKKAVEYIKELNMIR
ncbi:MAG: transglycosylase SLT domain-containing protein [Desulfobacterium sp.]|nr:transglycosylase SLT domain-containing protein [Desulfobacterium sp.]